MGIYKIVEIDNNKNNILRQKCKEVGEITPSILKLLDNLADTMRSARGVGLAAPQIGIPKRVVVLDPGDGLIELVNPEVVSAKGRQIDTEACLSAPGLMGEVARAYEVLVKGLNRDGKEVSLRAEGFAARVFQHEIDHLDGIMFMDRATSIKHVKRDEQ